LENTELEGIRLVPAKTDSFHKTVSVIS
jgi:hypothetical protein